MCIKCLHQAHQQSTKNPEFLLYIDNDDPQIEEYKKLLPHLKHINIFAYFGPPNHSGKAIKWLADKATHDYMMFASDDLQWHTSGWDEKLIAAMPEHGYGVVYPSTLPGGKATAMIPFFTRKWKEVTNLWPDEFEHFGPDEWVVTIGRLSNQFIYAKDVFIEHKRYKDETSNRARKNNDGSRAKSIIKGSQKQLNEIAQKLTQAINAC
jgi:hypothetical protein